MVELVTGIRTKARLFAIEPQICFVNSSRARSAHSFSRLVNYAITKARAKARAFVMEQVTGIEPAYSAWEADTLPLSYTCLVLYNYNIKCARCQVSERIFS